MEQRIKIVFAIFCIWFSILAFRLWYIQVLHKDKYTEMSITNRTRLVRLPSARGRIYDRNGMLLVDNKAAMQLVVLTDEVKNEKTLADEVAHIAGLSADYIIKKIKENLYKPFIPAVLASDMSDETLVSVAESMWRLPGIAIQVSPIRDYLKGAVFSHIIGYVGEAGRGDLENGYSWGDIVGRVGIEKVWDRRLRGKDGYKEVQVDHRGNVDSVLNIVEPVTGKDISLTIDSSIQEELSMDMKGHNGAGIMMDIFTGEILALVSSPGFDSNLFVSPVKEKTIADLFGNKNRPMLNRAISGLYPPGSVFKVIVALSALEKDVISRDTLFYCDGEFKMGNSRFRCWEKKGHGWVDLPNAIKKSCNEYFYQTGLKTGAEDIIDMAQRFGLGRATGIGLYGERSGYLPAKEILNKKWFLGDTVNLSIGPGRILVTAAQMACLMAAIANGGILYKPKLTLEEKTEGPEVKIDKKNIDIVKKGLLKVVKEPDGTGHSVFVEGLDIFGKTGTVMLKEGRREKNICWFSGFATMEAQNATTETQMVREIAANSKTTGDSSGLPIMDKRCGIAVVIVIEEGESGGVTAGPIARKVFKKWMEIEGSH